jgi:hemerythrin superfamily protein
MDIFEHIIMEHREIEGMMNALLEGYDEAVFKKLKTSLAAHMRAEEASLYPAMKGEAAERVDRAIEEHREVNGALQELGRVGGNSDAFTSKIAELKGMINDHVEEEENEIIPQARNMFDRETVYELSAKFNEVENMISQKV